MDWELAIKRNREALLRIVALLFAMVSSGAALPRATRNAVLRILRPAESAMRRLIVIAAREINPPTLSKTGARPDFSSFSCSSDHVPSFKLYDPRKRFAETNAPAPVFEPRISVPNVSNPVFETAAPRSDRSPNSAYLYNRMRALKAALDDLPKQAKRLARSTARRSLLPAGPRCVPPIRPGHPPGFAKRSDDEVHAILMECHGLARDLWATPP